MSVSAALKALGIIDDGFVCDDAPEQTMLYTPMEPVLVTSAVVQSGLKIGSSGNDVAAVQKALITLGFLKGKADGQFGPGTQAAVKAFQKAKGLDEVGVVGPHTLRYLGLVSSTPVNPPAPVMQPAAPEKWHPSSFKVASPRKLQMMLELAIDNQLMKTHPAELYQACRDGHGNVIVSLANKALAELKVREATNSNDGKFVELIQKTCGGRRGLAWCMYQQQTAVAYAERKLGKVSRLPASGGCADVRAKTPKNMQVAVSDCQAGDIWIWRHSSGSGHTGNFQSWIVHGKAAVMIEGNTTAGKIGGKIERNGGGTYQTERAVTYTGTMVLKMVVRAF